MIKTYKLLNLNINRDLNASINLKHYPYFKGKLSLWRTKTTGVVKDNETEFYEEGILHKVINVAYINRLL